MNADGQMHGGSLEGPYRYVQLHFDQYKSWWTFYRDTLLGRTGDNIPVCLPKLKLEEISRLTRTVDHLKRWLEAWRTHHVAQFLASTDQVTINVSHGAAWPKRPYIPNRQRAREASPQLLVKLGLRFVPVILQGRREEHRKV